MDVDGDTLLGPKSEIEIPTVKRARTGSRSKERAQNWDQGSGTFRRLIRPSADGECSDKVASEKPDKDEGKHKDTRTQSREERGTCVCEESPKKGPEPQVGTLFASQLKFFATTTCKIVRYPRRLLRQVG